MNLNKNSRKFENNRKWRLSGQELKFIMVIGKYGQYVYKFYKTPYFNDNQLSYDIFYTFGLNFIQYTQYKPKQMFKQKVCYF